MVLPFIAPELAPWIEFQEGTVVLKGGAPAYVIPLFEKLKASMEEADRVMFDLDQPL